MFKLEPIDNNIFMVIKKDSLSNGIYKKLPIKVYGFIRVNIFNKQIFSISTMNISEELTVSRELSSLTEEAKKTVRNYLNNN